MDGRGWPVGRKGKYWHHLLGWVCLGFRLFFFFLAFVVRMLEWIVGRQGLKTERWERRLSFDQDVSEKG